MKKSSKVKLGLLSGLYFILSLSYELRKLTHYRTTELFDVTAIALELSTLVIDGIFYIWLFSSLLATLDQLKSSERFKLDIYNQFTIVLILSLISTTIFNLYDAHYRRFFTFNSLLVVKNPFLARETIFPQTRVRKKRFSQKYDLERYLLVRERGSFKHVRVEP
jgi:hypothetical protein